MNDLIVRPAASADFEILAGMIDGFAKGHPAENHPRSADKMRDAFFGSHPIAHALLAEKNGAVVGFGASRRSYDMFWSMFGGEGIGLYVRPAHRGRGVALSIIAAMCAEIRACGGCFLQASYGPDRELLYERVAVGGPERACHVSVAAFEKLAGLSGRSVREIIRGLPDKALNYVPVQ
jgi:hypothetical protein